MSDVVLSEENYAYDAAGNITDAPDSTFSYDTNNRLTWYKGDPVSYDLDGNMLSAVLDGTNGTYFTYDSGNRLISAGGHTYTYNAEDVRIRNLCATEDTKYTYNTNCRLSKLLWKDTNGTVTKYVYGRGLIGEETGSSFTTYHFDCRGSTVALTDSTGAVTDTFEYDTYGKLISRTGTSNVIFLYNGRDGVVSDTNGLIYMRTRYYSPDMRRFVNADIIHGSISDSTSLNRYAYVNGNPVSYIDPFGLSAETKDGDSSDVQTNSKHLVNNDIAQKFELKFFYKGKEITLTLKNEVCFGPNDADISLQEVVDSMSSEEWYAIFEAIGLGKDEKELYDASISITDNIELDSSINLEFSMWSFSLNAIGEKTITYTDESGNSISWSIEVEVPIFDKDDVVTHVAHAARKVAFSGAPALSGGAGGRFATTFLADEIFPYAIRMPGCIIY